MLTNRQILRRLRTPSSRSHDKLYDAGLFVEDSSGDGGGSVHHATPPPLGDSPSSPDSVSASLHRPRVKFNTAVRVVLIPTVSEYRNARLADALWWADQDYKHFKDTALAELRDYLLQHPQHNSKAAISYLYQNNNGDGLMHQPTAVDVY